MNYWKKFFIFTLLLSLLVPFFPKVSDAAGTTCYTPNQPNKTYINVSVATLWKEPGTKRNIDHYSLSNPVDMKTWTAKMGTADSRRWLTGKTETQGLYGQEVKVLKTNGNWVQVAIVDQATSKNKDGYPGWMPKSQLTTQEAAYGQCEIASVKAKTASLYDDKKKKFLEVSFNTRLPVLAVENDWVQVMTPSNEAKWIKRSDIHIYSSLSDITEPSGTDLLNTGKQFLGLSYLWGGVSAYGFDCSGFTYSVYKYYGILIPRDASEQFTKGKSVSKDQLEPGDLMFFAYKSGKSKGKVHHVAMYAGNGKMIHSPQAGKNVEIISINTSPYKEEYAGGRRYVDVNQKVNDAKKLGESLLNSLSSFERKINSGNLAEINEQYDSFSNKIKAVEKAIGKVSGKANRDNLNNKYVRPAKIARERVIYEISQYRLLKIINDFIATDDMENMKKEMAKLERLQKRAVQIKKDGGYEPLPPQIEAQLRDLIADLKLIKLPAIDGIN
ncbi:NlpC/P60 family protein [Metabacillus fastidiosus]|uniref:NlpC/P60 family protein n=1 Tax=Metabacillus fastidiosus TaxID=1458 RepID=UPI002E23C0D0|nr:NlpC/P60 family protein [Metabacillus fastidiosus]